MDFSTLDFAFMVRELQTLVDARIQKIYLKDRVHVLQLYHKGALQLVVSDTSFCLSNAKLSFPPHPTGYTLFLRRRFANARIRGVRQLGSDRILVLDVETLEGQYEFIFELLDECNSMVVRGGIIVSCQSTQNYGGRVIRGGTAYMPPPARSLPEEVPTANLVGHAAAKTFATALGLGGRWGEEICARLGLSKTAKITPDDAARVPDLIVALRTQSLTPVYGGSIALPYPFITLPDVNTEATTFSAAVDAVQATTLVHAEAAVAGTVAQVQVTKQEKILRAQREQLTKIEAQAAQLQRSGELMYENYIVLTELLAGLKADWKKLNLGQLRDKYGSHPLVKSINEDATIDVELSQ